MKKSLIIFSLCFLLLIGFVSGFSFSDFFEKFTGKVVDYSNQPYCSGIGTRSESWRNSERFIKYDSCENCEAVCKLAKDKRVEGWYSSCDENLILEEECDCADTCLNLGYECGVQNVCGENINCGRCRLGQICNNGVCEECIPETCESLNYECGEIDDGCGGTLGCGSCVTGYDCVNGRCERVEGNETDNNKLCKKEGEQVNKNPFLGSVEECCEGLIEVRISKSYSTCVNCGDGICRSPEDEDNCVEDCGDVRIETRCSDETLEGKCSTTKPKYCREGRLIDNCLECECDKNKVCQEDGSCEVKPFCLNIGTRSEGWYNSDGFIKGASCEGCESICKDSTDKRDEGWYSSCDESLIVLEDCNCEDTCSSLEYNCGFQTICGEEIDCGHCRLGEICSEEGSCVDKPNKKDMTRYSDKEVFLISDKNWRDVLPLIPVTTWTEQESNNLGCQKGYGTADHVCVYPTLIYHEESTGFDIDSSIYFMQQYNPEKLTISGGTPQGLDNLLIAEPELGAGLENSQIHRINENDYLFYWESYGDIVYVEEDYELALLASTYASLLNAPLIIENSDLDNTNTFEGKEIICVGNVLPSGAICGEQYNLESLRKKYLEKTDTDKVILVNPDDLDIHGSTDYLNNDYYENFCPIKSISCFDKLYTKTSLSASILASAKHELILSTTETDYQEIDDFIEYEVDDLGINVEFLTIVAASKVIPSREFSWELDNEIYIYRSLDQTQYANFNEASVLLSFSYPDIAVGRIMGISSSDVSSYIARDLFYNNFEKTNNMKLMASTYILNTIEDTNRWAANFRSVNYNAIAVTNPQEYYNFNPNEWEGQDFIFYNDHGGSSWAGIAAQQIPLLKNSLAVIEACATCSRQYSFSFCHRTIRQGAIGYIGAIGAAFGDLIEREMINGIYYYNLSLGKSLLRSFNILKAVSPSRIKSQSMITLLGDPTFKLNPSNFLSEVLCSPLIHGIEICDNQDNNCNEKIDENCISIE